MGHDDLAAIEISDAGWFGDYLFDQGMSSSSVKRVFSSVHAVINLAIREQGLFINNVFSGTFIPDDEAKTSGFSRFGLGSVADEATGRFGDLKLREIYVFVFCVFG